MYYIEGSTGNTITWTVGDKTSDLYIVTLDGVLYQSTQKWSNVTIEINIDGLSAGTYTLVLHLFDLAGNLAEDTLVIVL